MALLVVDSIWWVVNVDKGGLPDFVVVFEDVGSNFAVVVTGVS